MKRLPILVMLAFITCTIGAKAQILEIDSRAAFDAAVTGQTTEDFESPGIPDYPDPNTRNLVSLDSPYTPTSGIGIFTASAGLYYAGSPSPNGLYSGDGSYYISTPGSANPVTFTLANPSSAAGSNIFAAGSGTFTGGTVTVTEQTIGADPVQDSQTFSFGAPQSTGVLSDTAFLGFIASAGENLISITYQGPTPADYVAFDNYSVGTAVVPEPSEIAYLMMGLGLVIGLQVIRRKYRSQI